MVNNANGTAQYQVSTFTESELPLTIGTQEDTHIGHNDTPILAMSNRVLYEHTKGPGGRTYLIELHKRFAYPAACLVLMLIGIPLGICVAARRQERRLCGDHRAGLHLLLPLFDRHFARARG